MVCGEEETTQQTSYETINGIEIYKANFKTLVACNKVVVKFYNENI